MPFITRCARRICLALLLLLPGPAAADPEIPAALRASGKYRAAHEFDTRITVRDFTPGAHDSLADYAAKCARATEIALPATFSCRNGVDVPGQGTTPAARPPAARCDHPNVLNGLCDPGSRFQVLAQSADAAAVMHCRKDGQPIAGETYNDIAIIQYNKKTGAVCFYQALSGLPGDDIPTPAQGEEAKWGDNQGHWFTPEKTEAIGCTGCHDSGGFIRSEYLAQLKTPPHALPSSAAGFDNLETPVRYVGRDFAKARSWSIWTAKAAGDTGSNCASCHRLAAPNRMAFGQINGTAAHFANVATAADQCVDGKCSKNPHGPASSIWMRPGQVFYKAAAEATASRYHDCAVGFFNSGFKTAPAGCEVTPLGEPWPEPDAVSATDKGESLALSYYLDDEEEKKIVPVINYAVQ